MIQNKHTSFCIIISEVKIKLKKNNYYLKTILWFLVIIIFFLITLMSALSVDQSTYCTKILKLDLSNNTQLTWCAEIWSNYNIGENPIITYNYTRNITNQIMNTIIYNNSAVVDFDFNDFKDEITVYTQELFDRRLKDYLTKDFYLLQSEVDKSKLKEEILLKLKSDGYLAVTETVDLSVEAKQKLLEVESKVLGLEKVFIEKSNINNSGDVLVEKSFLEEYWWVFLLLIAGYIFYNKFYDKKKPLQPPMQSFQSRMHEPVSQEKVLKEDLRL